MAKHFGATLIATASPGKHETVSALSADHVLDSRGGDIADYDAVVLDLSPNLGQLVITALNAADSLIIPTDATKWGRRGVTMFLEWSQALRNAQVMTAELLGVVLTKYELQTLVSRQTLDDLRGDHIPLFDAVIPKRVAAERMVNDRLVLGDADADPDLSQAYAALTVEVMHHIQTAHTRRGKHHRG